MLTEINFNCGISRCDCLNGDNEPLGTDLIILITSFVMGLLLGTALAIGASAPIAMTISLGGSIGLFLAIATVAYRRFSSNQDLSEDNNITQNFLTIQVTHEPFPNTFPKDLLRLFFSYTDLGLNSFRSIACASKDFYKLIYSINEVRVRALSKDTLLGHEDWKGFGWQFKANETKMPLIFPDIIEKLNDTKSNQGNEKLAVLLMPERIDLSILGSLVEKQTPRLHDGYWNKDNEVIPQLDFPAKHPYFVVISTNMINGSLNESYMQQSEILSLFGGTDGYKYRLPRLTEAVAFTFLYQFKFQIDPDKCPLSDYHTYTLEKIKYNEEIQEVTAGSFGTTGLKIIPRRVGKKFSNLGALAACSTINFESFSEETSLSRRNEDSKISKTC